MENMSDYLPTGFQSWDDKLGGLKRGNFYLLAGDFKMGKTAFALNLVCKVSHKNKYKSVYLSLNEGEGNLLSRLCLPATIKEIVTYEDYKKFRRDIRDKVVIKDNPGLTADAFIKTLEVVTPDADLLIIDGIDRLIPNSDYEDMDVTLERVFAELRFMAYKHNFVLVVLGDLTGEQRYRKRHRPFWSDVRYGMLPNLVDELIFIYRDDYYDQDSELKGIVEFIFDDTFHSTIGKIEMAWIPQYCLFADLERDY